MINKNVSTCAVSITGAGVNNACAWCFRRVLEEEDNEDEVEDDNDDDDDEEEEEEEEEEEDTLNMIT